MPTDLKSVADHPANFLFATAQVALNSGDLTSATDLMTDAALLVAYEASHDVTFAALDNDALEDVYETYNGGNIEEIEAFVSAVNNLLGLDD